MSCFNLSKSLARGLYTLTQKIKQGDQAATDKLLKGNLRFVVPIAKKDQLQGLSLPG